MPVILYETRSTGPTQQTYVSPLHFVTSLQSALGVTPQNGVWDDALTDAILTKLRTRWSPTSAPVMTLEALKTTRQHVSAADAAAAAWVFSGDWYEPSDPRVSEAPRAFAPVSAVSVSGWTPFRYETLAPPEAPPQIQPTYVPPPPPQPHNMQPPPVQNNGMVLGFIPKPVAKAAAFLGVVATATALATKYLPKRGE